MDKEQTAIGRIKIASDMSLNFYRQPIMVCVSGGKDSDVLLELTRRAGVPFEIQHSLTTVDAPQTVYHVRDIFRRHESDGICCTLNKSTMTMWQLIVHKKMPPTRISRYCCQYLKEQHGKNRHILTGVRWSESNQRKKRGIYEDVRKNKDDRIILANDNDDRRRLTERCQVLAKTITNPIIDWTDKDIYSYIEDAHININPLYNMGFNRVGCIGCPIADKKKRCKEFELLPTYKRAYIRAFDKMLDARRSAGLTNSDKWRDGNMVFRWWMEEVFNPDQLSLFDDGEDEDEDNI